MGIIANDRGTFKVYVSFWKKIDFFLLGYLKGKLTLTSLNFLQQFKLKTIQEINRITSDILSAVMNSFTKRVRLCLTKNGNHLNDIIFLLSCKINIKSSSTFCNCLYRYTFHTL